MSNDSVPAVNMRLRPGEPVYVEVVINPAAHGEAGLGPIQRSVILQTGAGTQIQLDLTAVVVR